MKKASLLFITAMTSLIAMSCSSKATGDASSAEGSEASEQAKGLNTSSFDKTTFELSGPVATCITEEQYFCLNDPNDKVPEEYWPMRETITFDTAGNLVSYLNSSKDVAKDPVRDDFGRIIKIVVPTVYEEDYEGEDIMEYAYDGNAETSKVASIRFSDPYGDCIDKYTRDPQDRIGKVKHDTHGIYDCQLKYNYLETDAYGNWTKLEIINETYGGKDLKRRKITYHE